jgi:hypothetical protein
LPSFNYQPPYGPLLAVRKEVSSIDNEIVATALGVAALVVAILGLMVKIIELTRR